MKSASSQVLPSLLKQGKFLHSVQGGNISLCPIPGGKQGFFPESCCTGKPGWCGHPFPGVPSWGRIQSYYRDILEKQDYFTEKALKKSQLFFFFLGKIMGNLRAISKPGCSAELEANILAGPVATG